MTRIIVTTIRRNARADVPSGYIYVIDPESQRVIQRSSMIEPPYRDVDINPRGGLRGSRGIAIREDLIAIANATAVFFYDPNWDLAGMISHPCCSTIHDIAFQDSTLWMTSARNDLLFQFSLSGEMIKFYDLRESPVVSLATGWKPPLLISKDLVNNCQIDFRNPLTHLEAVYDNAHVNSISLLQSGGFLVSLGQVISTKYAYLMRVKDLMMRWGLWSNVVAINQIVRRWLNIRKDLHSELVLRPVKSQSVVMRISQTGDRSLSLLIKDTTTPSHSLCQLPDRSTIYLNTTSGSVIHFDQETGDVFSSLIVTDGYLRGIAQLSRSSLIMGSKNELIVYDIEKRRVDRSFKITGDSNESIYDVKLLPGRFVLPPESFESHFLRLTGHQAASLVRTGGMIIPDDIV